MESPSGSSPLVILAEESLSMNLRFMRRRRRLKATKCAGSDPLLSHADICDQQPLQVLTNRLDVSQVHADRGRLSPPQEGPADTLTPASGPL